MSIFEAVENNDIEAVRKYIHQVNDTDNNDGDTALTLASFYGHKEACQLLLDNGTDVNHIDKYGDTALSLARKEEIIELLKMYGVSRLVII